MDLSSCSKVIVFGGTFDPPTVAHLDLPKLVMEKVGADAVIYVPTSLSPFKTDSLPASNQHRLNMLRLVLRDEPWAFVSYIEIANYLGKPVYTIDTLRMLRKEFNRKLEIRLLIGSDQLLEFDKWKEPEEIVKIAEPLVMIRPPATRGSLLANLPKGFDPDEWLERIVMTPILLEVSSTEIRRRRAEDKPIIGLVSPVVAGYIYNKGLYRNET